MGQTRRRRLRRPVFSRLTLAWAAFACAGLALISYAVVAGGGKRSDRIALALDGEIERFAPPRPARAPGPAADDRLTPAFGAAGADAGEAGAGFPAGADAFGGEDIPYTDGMLEIEPSGVVITIDGAPPRDSARGALGMRTASLTRRTASIPDPDPALLQQTPLGRIPKIAGDGRRAARVYARPYQGPAESPRVAVIVGGLGLNRDLTARAIDELAPDVTLAFAPYAKDLDYWTARARGAGHEIMIELPMETHGGVEGALGPAALLTGRPAADNLRRLDWLLARFGGYFAATNYLGAKFSADATALAPVLKRLDALGIAYVDDTGAAPAGGRIVDRMILAGDGGADIRAAQGDLGALEALAARAGEALGKAYVSEATIGAIRAWTVELDGGDIVLAPASAVLQARSNRG